MDRFRILRVAAPAAILAIVGVSFAAGGLRGRPAQPQPAAVDPPGPVAARRSAHIERSPGDAPGRLSLVGRISIGEADRPRPDGDHTEHVYSVHLRVETLDGGQVLDEEVGEFVETHGVGGYSHDYRAAYDLQPGIYRASIVAYTGGVSVAQDGSTSPAFAAMASRVVRVE